MTRFHVDAAEVSSASALAATSGDQIRAEVAAMMGHLHALENTWQGAASVAFAGVLEQWRVAQVQVETALGSLSQALASAASQYETAEDNVAQMFTAR